MTTYVKDAFTVIQTAGETYIGADAGEDTTYFISPTLIQAGDVITIIDDEGSNTLQLPDGLSITSSIVANDEAVLILSNGAQVNIRGAASFSFDVGGNDLTGDIGVEKTFTEFVEQDLGLTVPAEGEDPVTGEEVIIGNTAPDAVDDTDLTASANIATELDVLANDTDADEGDTVVFDAEDGDAITLTEAPEGSTATVTYDTVNNVINFQADIAGTYTFDYTVKDDTGTTDTATVTVTVDDTIYGLDADTSEVSEGATASFTLTTENVPEGTEVAYTISGVTAEDVVDGLLTGTVAVDADGAATIEVALVDDGVMEESETLIVTIDADPEATADMAIVDTNTPEEITLISGAETVEGGQGDDIIVGMTSSTSTSRTLDTTDDIDGGDGTDTLVVDVMSNFSGFTGDGGMSSVEILELENTSGFSRTFDMTGATGVEEVALTAGNDDFIINDAAAVFTLNLEQSEGTTTVNYADGALAGTSDEMMVYLNGVGSEDAEGDETLVDFVVTTDDATEDLETITLVSTGANYITTNVAGSTTLNILGDDLSVVDDVVETIDATEATGNVSIDSDAATSISTGAGADTIDSDAASVEFVSTGAGDDDVNINSISALAELGGGEGVDTLTLDQDTLAGIRPSITGFEHLVLAASGGAATADMQNSSGFETITLNQDATHGIGLANLGSADLIINVDTGSSDAAPANMNLLESSFDHSGTTELNLMDSNADEDDDTDGTITNAVISFGNTAALTVNAYVAVTNSTISAASAEVAVFNANAAIANSTLTVAAANEVTIYANADITAFTLNAASASALTVDAGDDDDITAMTINAADLQGAELTLNSSDGGASTLTFDTESLEELIIDTKQDVTTVNTDLSALASVVITGTGDVDLDATSLENLSSVDASGSTGALALDSSFDENINIIGSTTGANTVVADDAAAGAAVYFVGGTGVDTVTTGDSDDTLDLDLGDDVVTAAGAGDDTIDAGLGADDIQSITIGGDSINMGLGNDTVTIDAVEATETDSSIDGDLGTDTLEIAAGLTIEELSIANFEELDITGATDVTTLNASAVSGQEIELDGATAIQTLALTGTTANDTIDLSDLTQAGGNAVTIQVEGSDGDDTITASAGTDVFSYTADTQFGDTINDFASGTDAINLDVGGSNAASGGKIFSSAAVASDNLVSLNILGNTGTPAFAAKSGSLTAANTFGSYASVAAFLAAVNDATDDAAASATAASAITQATWIAFGLNSVSGTIWAARILAADLTFSAVGTPAATWIVNVGTLTANDVITIGKADGAALTDIVLV